MIESTFATPESHSDAAGRMEGAVQDDHRMMMAHPPETAYRVALMRVLDELNRNLCKENSPDAVSKILEFKDIVSTLYEMSCDQQVNRFANFKVIR